MAAPTTTESLSGGLPGAQGAEASERTEAAARALVEEAFLNATAILEQNLDVLHQAADRLIAEEALERDDLYDLFGPRPSARRLTPSLTRREA